MASSVAVKDHMTKTVVTFKPDMDVLESIHVLLAKGVPGGPVVDDVGNLVGMLSDKDCLNAALSASYHEQWGGRVSEFMSTDVQTVDAEDSVVDVARRFIDCEFRHFPVIKEGRMVGYLSRRDVLRALELLRHAER
jgi:CBS domain-containing protein